VRRQLAVKNIVENPEQDNYCHGIPAPFSVVIGGGSAGWTVEAGEFHSYNFKGGKNKKRYPLGLAPPNIGSPGRPLLFSTFSREIGSSTLKQMPATEPEALTMQFYIYIIT
jgi:hypothetical protein